MRRRHLGTLVFVLLALLALDVAAALFVLPGYWRPLPPFGATTNQRQQAWLERQRLEIGGEAEPSGIGRFDPLLGWALRPDAASADGGTTTDARGWRGRRGLDAVGRDAVGGEGRTRIATFGDSFTFCDEVDDADTWQSELERLDPSLEVPNLGVGGYGTDQALLRARGELGALGADVVLVGLLLENIGRNVNRYRPRWYPNAENPVAKPRFVLSGGELELVPLPFADRSELVAAVADGSVLELLGEHEHWSDDHLPALLGWSAFARLVAGRRFYAERSLERLWNDVDGEPFRTSVAILSEFRDLALEHGARSFGVLVFPIREDLERLFDGRGRYWSSLTDELGRRGIAHLDLSHSLEEARRTSPAVGPQLYRGSHLSPSGNAVVAAAIRDWLVTVDPEVEPEVDPEVDPDASR